jgi:broad specificity phosphatase PhoE
VDESAPAAVTAARVLLVRHGQSTWNAEQRWQGQADPPLSAMGEHQAQTAASAVRELAPVLLVSSDLSRARRTAELLAPSGVGVTVEPGWRERHAGEWTGLTRAEIDARYPGWLSERRSPPGFESDEAVLGRTLPILGALARAVTGTALVVTHGGVIRTLERHFHAPSLPVPNLGGRWFHPEGGAVALGDRDVLVDVDAVTVPDQVE